MSSSSSSSADVIRTGKSSLVFQDPVRTPEWARWSAVLDLDAIDTVKAKGTAWHYVDLSGSYAGYGVTTHRVRVADGAKFTLTITPRRLASEENAVLSAWREVVLSRTRAALKDIREEYDASTVPSGAPVGHEL